MTQAAGHRRGSGRRLHPPPRRDERPSATHRAAVQQLFARYYERVRRIVRLRLGRTLRGKLDSNDILQEVFLDALRNLDRFQMLYRGSFINWLARMAEHRIRDAADFHGAAKRDAAREVPMAWEDTSGLDHGLTATGLAPLDGAARADEIRRLEDAIERLSPEDRELVIWRTYADADWETVVRETIKRLARLMGEA
ncbi:MAG: sigma-70 family RNA polymerase sigma factor [Planctomycetes bacterium]|nr:sigma-70 family RNA polymerase sigma factor [Planctomycetota bacterium]